MAFSFRLFIALIVIVVVAARKGKGQFARKVSRFELTKAKSGGRLFVACDDSGYVCQDGYYCCNLDNKWVCCEDGDTCTIPKLGTCSPPTTTEGYGTSYFDECIYHPCENGGTCYPYGNPYTCYCPPNYYGMNCQYYQEPSSIQQGSTTEAVSPCHSDTCQNGGTCIVYGGLQYRCHCAPDYSGTNCEYYDGQTSTPDFGSTWSYFFQEKKQK